MPSSMCTSARDRTPTSHSCTSTAAAGWSNVYERTSRHDGGDSRPMATVNGGTIPAERIVTIGDFVERVYLPWIGEHKRPSTAKGYRDIWEDHLKPLAAQASVARTCYRRSAAFSFKFSPSHRLANARGQWPARTGSAVRRRRRPGCRCNRS